MIDTRPIKLAAGEILKKEIVKECFEKREKIRRVKFRGSLEENMLKMRIVVKKNGKLVPTNAGILFFKEPSNLDSSCEDSFSLV